MKNLPLKFERLTLIDGTLKYVKLNNRKRWFVDVRCKCGTRKTINANDYKRGKIKSCGCLFREQSRERIIAVNKKYQETGNYPGKTHGDSKRRLHTIWSGMKSRCYNPNSAKYPRYGGRGITIEWSSYEDFKKDMYGSYLEFVKKHGEKDTTINRIDNDGNYSKKNCCWATLRQQANNTKRNNFITYQGLTLSVSEWSRKLGINRATLNSRINIKKLTDPAKILAPVGKQGRR